MQCLGVGAVDDLRHECSVIGAGSIYQLRVAVIGDAPAAGFTSGFEGLASNKRYIYPRHHRQPAQQWCVVDAEARMPEHETHGHVPLTAMGLSDGSRIESFSSTGLRKSISRE